MERKVIDAVDKATLALCDVLYPDYQVAISGHGPHEVDVVVVKKGEPEEAYRYIGIKFQQGGAVNVASGSLLKCTYQPETQKRTSRTFWLMILARALQALGIN